MSVDHPSNNYYEIEWMRFNRKFRYRVCRFDATINSVVIVHESPAMYSTENQAFSACAAWLKYNGAEAEPS